MSLGKVSLTLPKATVNLLNTRLMSLGLLKEPKESYSCLLVNDPTNPKSKRPGQLIKKGIGIVVGVKEVALKEDKLVLVLDDFLQQIAKARKFLSEDFEHDEERSYSPVIELIDSEDVTEETLRELTSIMPQKLFFFDFECTKA